MIKTPTESFQNKHKCNFNVNRQVSDQYYDKIG